MGRVLLLSLLFFSASAAAQTAAAPPASKHFRLPPPEGVARRLPKAFDFSPVLRFDGNTDCRAFVVRTAAEGTPPPPPVAKLDERYDGCIVIRRETADPFSSPGRTDPDRMI